MSTAVVPFQPNINAITAAIASANDAFDDSDADIAAYIADSLDMGMTAGMNPLTLANYLSFLVGPQRAENIARTEMLGGYRDAALNMYRDNSDVVGGWMWSAAAGACVACSEEDGTIHDLDEDMDGMTHNSCRCSPIPITNPWSDILGPLGIDVSDIPDTSILDDYVPLSETFWQRSFEEQAGILGSKSAAEAVSRGILEPADFVGHIEGGAYDGALYTKSLREALADAKGMSKAEIADLKAELLQAVKGGETEAARQAEEMAATAEERALVSPLWDAKVAEVQAPYLEAYAAKNGMSVAEYERAVADHLQQLTKDANMEVRVSSPRALRKLITDGRFKSQLEDGAVLNDYAVADEEARQALEHNVFGLAENDDHLIFAYLSPDIAADAPNVRGYGDIVIELNPGLAERATVTFGDTNDLTDGGTLANLAPSPLRDISPRAWDYSVSGDPLALSDIQQLRSGYAAYAEVQIQGGVTTDDIRQIVFTGDRGPSAALRAKLDEAGISWQRMTAKEYNAGIARYLERPKWMLDRVPVDVSPEAARFIPGEAASQTDAEKALATAQSKVASLVQSGAPYDDIRAAKWEAAQAQAAVDAEQGGRGAAIFIENPRADPLNSAQFEQTMDNLFGRQLTRDELGGLVGAPQGAFVNVYASSDGERLSFILRGPGWVPGDVSAAGQPEYEAWRSLMRDSRSDLMMNNVSFVVREDMQGQGLGARIFADEVDTLSKLDVQYIETEAGGSAAEIAAGTYSANGYYTWPRLGYDAPLPQDARDALGAAIARGQVPAAWGTFDTLSELMTAPGGPEWWKANGISMQMHFDLTEGSYSRQALHDYLDKKGLEAGSVSGVVSEEVAAARAAADTVSAMRDALGIGSAEDIKAAAALMEPFYKGMPVGDVMQMMASTDPAVKAAVKLGEDMADKVIGDLAERLQGNGAFMRLARYLGYDRDQVGAWMTTWENAQRAAKAGRTLSEEDRAVVAMTRAEAQVWAKQGAFKGVVYDLFEAFHNIPESVDEHFVQSSLQVAMQEAVKAEFRLTRAAGYWSDEAVATAKAEWGTYQNGMRAFFRAMYDNTQAWFKEQGISEVQLFRGLRWTADAAPAELTFDGKVVAASVVDMAPMTSWATDADVALAYASEAGGVARTATAEAEYGMMLMTVVPVDQIIGTPFTGFGAPPLRELIALGVPDDALALPFAMSDAPSLADLFRLFAGEGD